MTRERPDRTRLAALARVGQAIRDRDLAALAAAGREIERIEAEIAALVAMRARRAAEISALDRPDPALLAGIDAQWARGLDRRHRALDARLARAHADREEARAKAALAVGRADVLDRIAKGRSR